MHRVSAEIQFHMKQPKICQMLTVKLKHTKMIYEPQHNKRT